MNEKINISRFCDLQGVNDFDRQILEKKFATPKALYKEWYQTVKNEGFEIGDLKEFEEQKKEEKQSTDKKINE